MRSTKDVACVGGAGIGGLFHAVVDESADLLSIRHAATPSRRMLMTSGLSSALSICQIGFRETEPFEQMDLEFFDVYLKTETLKKG